VRKLIIGSLLLLASFAFYASRKQANHAPKLIPVAAQVPCPGPVLRFLDPITHQEVTHIDFGSVPIGKTKTVQVLILNPIVSPCNLQVIQADGNISFKEIPR
jgi:hypothetical protein